MDEKELSGQHANGHSQTASIRFQQSCGLSGLYRHNVFNAQAAADGQTEPQTSLTHKSTDLRNRRMDSGAFHRMAIGFYKRSSRSEIVLQVGDFAFQVWILANEQPSAFGWRFDAHFSAAL